MPQNSTPAFFGRPTSSVLPASHPNRGPFFKWAGGKSKLLSQLLPLLPEGKRLIEPFVGAGSVFLSTNFESYVIGDTNEDLMRFTRHSRTVPTSSSLVRNSSS